MELFSTIHLTSNNLAKLTDCGGKSSSVIGSIALRLQKKHINSVRNVNIISLLHYNNALGNSKGQYFGLILVSKTAVLSLSINEILRF